ncbi:hypothetical protein HPB50_000598 [Hyalomma asiaticum]|uniref:Uncharacterized protein n=1 Tax=Hyalomma asiaticum TaxID=266040 RepID=A0ACB7RH82_HYAAI|nr:hypothetical protein HPB50_000598 [Hyalomma asiaticum]
MRVARSRRRAQHDAWKWAFDMQRKYRRRKKPCWRVSQYREATQNYATVTRGRLQGGAVSMTGVKPAVLADAISTAAKLDARLALPFDQATIHPTNNSVAVSTPDQQRAEAYYNITRLQHTQEKLDTLVTTYIPAPENSLRGLGYRAYSYGKDQRIFAELRTKSYF